MDRTLRVMAAVLLIGGAYTALSFYVDSWEGHRCWMRGDAVYDRLPFITALQGAIGAASARAASRPFSAAIELAMFTAFLWPVGAVWLARGWIIPTISALLICIPFAITLHTQVNFGISAYCNDSGMNEVGFLVMQLLFVLPIGLISFLVAANR